MSHFDRELRTERLKTERLWAEWQAELKALRLTDQVMLPASVSALVLTAFSLQPKQPG